MSILHIGVIKVSEVIQIQCKKAPEKNNTSQEFLMISINAFMSHSQDTTKNLDVSKVMLFDLQIYTVLSSGKVKHFCV